IVLVGGAVLLLTQNAPAVQGAQAQPTPPEGACDQALACTPPSPDEVSSLSGAFRLSYTSDVGNLPMNQIHTWTLHVETADGAPVEDALITVDGGMPAHNHGLPTSPAVTMYLGDGNYRVEGMKFHMGGAWVVDFAITAGGVTDTARFDLVIQ
ncbi:MAG TPA: FixH family protein, partial [Anaerolineaceae bacterium]|nr:FixH family protein [Anaerolineaceae bacterium]